MRGNFIIIGQSRGGFSGDTRWPNPPGSPGTIFYNYLNDQFTQAVDPLPGWNTPPGPNAGGSIWSRLGHLLWYGQPEAERIYSTGLCFAPFTQDNSKSVEWTHAANFYWNWINYAKERLHVGGLEATAYIWVQGEADATISQPEGEYYNNVMNMVEGMRATGNNVPIFICQSTHCRVGGPDSEGLPPQDRLNRVKWQTRVQKEQQALMLRCDKGMYPGADFDKVCGLRDYCHMSGGGQDMAALLMWEVITKAYHDGVITGQA